MGLDPLCRHSQALKSVGCATPDGEEGRTASPTGPVAEAPGTRRVSQPGLRGGGDRLYSRY